MIEKRPQTGRLSKSARATGRSGTLIGARTVGRRKERGEFVGGHLPAFLEAAAQEHLGGLVEEDEAALGIDDENRHGKAAGRLPHENDLDFLLCHGSPRWLGTFPPAYAVAQSIASAIGPAAGNDQKPAGGREKS